MAIGVLLGLVMAVVVAWHIHTYHRHNLSVLRVQYPYVPGMGTIPVPGTTWYYLVQMMYLFPQIFHFHDCLCIFILFCSFVKFNYRTHWQHLITTGKKCVDGYILHRVRLTLLACCSTLNI